MPGAVLTEELNLVHGGGRAPSGGGRDGGGRGPGADPARERRLYLTGMALFLVPVLMFFMSLTSSYIVRKGLGADWQALTLPKILWLNTAVLLASSATIEIARRKLRRGQPATGEFRLWWGLTSVLGALFLAGQVVAWRQLAEAGVFLSTNPSSSFFYLLTAAHGTHLLLGIAMLFFVAIRSWQRARITRGVAAEIAAVYWHFMDGLWVFLLLLLNSGR